MGGGKPIMCVCELLLFFYYYYPHYFSLEKEPENTQWTIPNSYRIHFLPKRMPQIFIFIIIIVVIIICCSQAPRQ